MYPKSAPDTLPLDQVEPPIVLLEGTEKDTLSIPIAQEPEAKKPLALFSPEWQSSLLFQPDARYSPGPVGRERLLGPLPYMYDSPVETQCRGRRATSLNSNNVNCWLMALMTLNTLAVCLGLWQLRLRASRMMHAQEEAIGELTDAIRSHFPSLFDQGIETSSLMHSHRDGHGLSFNEWAPTNDKQPMSAQEDQSVPLTPLSPSLRSSTFTPQFGAAETRLRRPPTDFLLSPTVDTSHTNIFQTPSDILSEAYPEGKH